MELNAELVDSRADVFVLLDGLQRHRQEVPGDEEPLDKAADLAVPGSDLYQLLGLLPHPREENLQTLSAVWNVHEHVRAHSAGPVRLVLPKGLPQQHTKTKTIVKRRVSILIKPGMSLFHGHML